MVNGHAVLQKHCFLCMWRTWSNQTCKVIRFCASNSCSARTTAFLKSSNWNPRLCSPHFPISLIRLFFSVAPLTSFPGVSSIWSYPCQQKCHPQVGREKEHYWKYTTNSLPKVLHILHRLSSRHEWFMCVVEESCAVTLPSDQMHHFHLLDRKLVKSHRLKPDNITP